MSGIDLAALNPLDWQAHAQLGLVFGLAAIALLVQSILGTVREVQTQRIVNRRLRFKEKVASTRELIVELRRQRALDESGDFKLAIRNFNKLVTRSGLPFHPFRWTVLSLIVATLVAGAIAWRFNMPMLAAGIGGIVFFLAPLAVLKFCADRRTKQLAAQMPDALQIVVRSLEAGHPVPSAISLVAREMPDPIGTEFGMAADEMSYGMSLSAAAERLSERAGDPDVDLFAATVRLQEKTGGNLCDLLKTNAETIRDRQTLRLKVKAATSEGRASATILTVAPFIVMAAIHFLRPEFYGLVADEALFRYSLVGFGIWMMIGNFIMNRMINFRF